jgi:hypothetical protein
VNIACSFTALHWLSQTQDLGTFHDPNCFCITSADPIKDSEKIQYMKNMANVDLQNFLLARKTELMKDGLLMFSAVGSEMLIPSDAVMTDKSATARNQFNAKSVEAVPWNHPLLCLSHDYKEIGLLLQRTREHFHLSVPRSDSQETRISTLYPRSPEEVRQAIHSHPDLKNTFEILFCEVVNVPDPYWSKYITGEYDSQTYATFRAGFIRAWSETTVRKLLMTQDEAPIEWFYNQLKEAIQSDPTRFYLEHNYLYCCLKKT